MPPWNQMDRELIRGALLPVTPLAAPGSTARPAAVAAVLTQTRSGVELLLIRRAERRGDPWSGHMALPGGHAEPGDASLLETAIRETREELGIELDPERHSLGALEDLSPVRSSNLVVRPYVFALERVPPLTLSDEVAEALWVPVQDIPSPAASAVHRVRLGEQELSFPAFHIGNHAVWGFTYRVVHRLIERVVNAHGMPLTSGAEHE